MRSASPRKAVTLLYVQLMFWYGSFKSPLSMSSNLSTNLQFQPVCLGYDSVSPSLHCRSFLLLSVPSFRELCGYGCGNQARWEEQCIKHHMLYPIPCTHPQGTAPNQQSFPSKPSTISIGRCVCPIEIQDYWWTAWGRGERLQLHSQVMRAKTTYFNRIMKGARCLISLFVESSNSCAHTSLIFHYKNLNRNN